MCTPPRIARHSGRGGVLIETAIVLSVLLVLVGIVVDIHFLFVERAALQDIARLGARVVAAAPTIDTEDPEALRTYATEAVQRALRSADLDPENYYIDVWAITNVRNDKEEHHVQVTVSRKVGGRSYLIPETFFQNCAGSTMFIESRLPISKTTTRNNPDCNPGGADED